MCRGNRINMIKDSENKENNSNINNISINININNNNIEKSSGKFGEAERVLDVIFGE